MLFPIFFHPAILKLLGTSDESADEKSISLSKVKESFLKQQLPFKDVIKYLDEYKDLYLQNENKSLTDNQIKIGVRKKLRQKGKIWNVFGLFLDTEFLHYIPLHLIVFFINKFIQESSTSEKFPQINENSLQEFYTFDNYVNLDPNTCIAPIIPTYVRKDGKTPTLYPFKAKSLRYESKVITNIWISTEAFGTSLKQYVNSIDDPENFDIISFLKSFLKTIENSLGGINNFDLEYSEEYNLFTITDRKFPNPPKKEDIPIINGYGASSILLDLSIQTKITNKLGAQISIAAQGPGGEAQFNSSMPEFKKWNKDLIDRFDPPEAEYLTTGVNTVLAPPSTGNSTVLAPQFSQVQTSSARQALAFDPLNPSRKGVVIGKPKGIKTKDEEEFIKKADAFYEKLEKLYTQWFDGILNEDDGWNSILTQGQTYYSMIASDFRTSKGLPAEGIIPTVVSLKVEGVGGVKIGQSFRLNEGILPDRYNKEFGYIVTGIEHAIENNRWITEIKGQSYYIGIPDVTDKSTSSKRLSRFYPYRESTGQKSVDPIAEKRKNDDNTQYTLTPGQPSQEFRGVPPGIGVIANDPAPIINSGKIGSNSYTSSNLAKAQLAARGQNGLLDIKNSKFLVFIGETQGASNFYINPATNRAEYMLAPAAAQAWYKWRDEMKAKGIPYVISSAYRSTQHQAGLGSSNTVAKPGSSPHGWGGALDFGNLYRVVGGKGEAGVNLTGRRTDLYKNIAETGAKYGWYNPWRLSNNQGLNEIWHFEYWG